MKASESMFSCDVCKKPVDGNALVGISAKHMQRAVRDGFNPFEVPEIAMPAPEAEAEESHLDDETCFETWREAVLGTNVDWRLCPTCMGALFKATASADEARVTQTEDTTSGLIKSAGLLLSPAGGLVAMVFFFFPWATHSLTHDSFYAWDEYLGGVVLWLSFCAALVIVLLSLLHMLEDRSTSARSIAKFIGSVWVVAAWVFIFLGLVLTAIMSLAGTVAYRWEWEMFLGIFILVVFLILSLALIRRPVSEGRSRLTPGRLVALTAMIGLAMIVVRGIQMVNGPYEFLGATLHYDDVRRVIDIEILYGAWGTVAGFLLAMAGSPFLRSHDTEKESSHRPSYRGRG